MVMVAPPTFALALGGACRPDDAPRPSGAVPPPFKPGTQCRPSLSRRGCSITAGIGQTLGTPLHVPAWIQT